MHSAELRGSRFCITAEVVVIVVVGIVSYVFNIGL